MVIDDPWAAGAIPGWRTGDTRNVVVLLWDSRSGILNRE
jgi:hypothetical protein